MYGASNFQIGNQRFINITQDDDGAVANKGFVGGLYLVGFDAEVVNGKSYGVIGDIYGQDIKTVDAGSGLVQDSDLVRAFAETNSTETFDITFGNVTGRNVAKRLVKAASCAGITMGNINSFTDDIADGGIEMHATVECLSSAINWKFGRVENEGPATRVVWLKGSGNTCGNVFDGYGSLAVIFGEAANEANSCQVGNIQGRGGLPSGSLLQGIAVQLARANGCQSGNISGLFAVSVLSQSDNTGRNTVGDVAGGGRIDVTFGETHIGKITCDARPTPYVTSHFVLGGKFALTETNLITDGRVTVSVVGSDVDGDFGNFKVSRVESTNGIESNHTVLTTASATSGKIRGSVEVNVAANIAGTQSGTSGKSLIYIAGLDYVDMEKLQLINTDSVRGATGFNMWINDVNGQIGRLAIKAAYFGVTTRVDGKICITKAEQLLNSDLTLSNEVNINFIEKAPSATVTGANNTPATVNSTR